MHLHKDHDNDDPHRPFEAYIRSSLSILADKTEENQCVRLDMSKQQLRCYSLYIRYKVHMVKDYTVMWVFLQIKQRVIVLIKQ